MRTKSIVNIFIEVLTGTAGKTGKEQFYSWINKSKENRESFEQFKVFWERSGKVYENHDFDSVLAQKKMIAKLYHKQQKARITKISYSIAIAASVLLLIGLGYLVNYTVFQAGNTILYSAADNEVKEITLPDSSHVWLNQNSSLQLTKSFNKIQRKVHLKGEAWFEITPDKEKAFFVITGKITTKVLGTSFNLKAYDNENIQLTVNTGRVEFYDRYSFKERKVFSAGSVGVYSPASEEILQLQNKNMNYLSWKTGILTFSNSTLDEVCKTLSTHYKVNIISQVANPEISLTCTFHNDGLQDILSTISITLDFDIEESDNGSIIIKSRDR